MTRLGFVDDVNILACRDFTEENCHLLEKIHNNCLGWASHHGTTFVSQKYKLMHLTHLWKFNMVVSIQLPGGLKMPSLTVQVLEVLLDPKLCWGPHIHQTCNHTT